MSTRPDLSAASREELLAVIAEQQALIEQLQQRIAELEARLGGHGTGGPPGNKPMQAQPWENKARKRREQGFGRARMAPTRRVEHAMEQCPDCGERLKGGWVQRRREVIELPLAPVEVTEHVFIARVCPLCGKRRVPLVELGESVLGRQRLGVNLVSLIVTLREEGRLPVRTIQWYLRTVHQLEVSAGEIVGLLQRVAGRAQAVVAGIRQQVRASPAVCADETGWREDGHNGYVWTFSTPTTRLFLRRGRNKEVVDEVLGEDFSGVLVSDFYAAYDHYPGLHQRCWPHLLRDIHNLKLIYPADAALSEWAQRVQGLYEEAKAFRSDDQRRRLQAQERFERRLLELAAPYAEDPLAVQARLCRRIGRFIKQLLVFVGHPSVPADNNQAERSLRHLVTCRKISGGTRSEAGTSSKMVLASLFGTWRAQRLNPFVHCRRLLVSPQV
jgi:hypothetical protein